MRNTQLFFPSQEGSHHRAVTFSLRARWWNIKRPAGRLPRRWLLLRQHSGVWHVAADQDKAANTAVCTPWQRQGEPGRWSWPQGGWPLRSWHLCLSTGSSAKWFIVQGTWGGGGLVSCWGSCNMSSVLFMHLSVWGHAVKSGVNWGYEGIPQYCWWCFIPQPSHIKGKSPLDLLDLCLFHEAFPPLWLVGHVQITSLFDAEALTQKADVLK